MSDYCSHGFAIGDPCYDCLRTENAAIAAMVDEITATLGERYGMMTTVEGVRAAMADLAALEKALSDNRVLRVLLIDRLQHAHNTIDEMAGEIEALRKELAAKDARIAEQTSAALGLAAAIELRNTEIKTLRKELAAKDARIGELETKLFDANAAVEADRGEFGRDEFNAGVITGERMGNARAERAEAQVKVLREALERISAMGGSPETLHTLAAEIARAALNPSLDDSSR